MHKINHTLPNCPRVARLSYRALLLQRKPRAPDLAVPTHQHVLHPQTDGLNRKG